MIVVLPNEWFENQSIVIRSNDFKPKAKNSEHLQLCLLEIFVLKSAIGHLWESFNRKAVRSITILVKLTSKIHTLMAKRIAVKRYRGAV